VTRNAATPDSGFIDFCHATFAVMGAGTAPRGGTDRSEIVTAVVREGIAIWTLFDQRLLNSAC